MLEGFRGDTVVWWTCRDGEITLASESSTPSLPGGERISSCRFSQKNLHEILS